MKRYFWILFLLLASFVVTGCKVNVGQIDVKKTTKSHDDGTDKVPNPAIKRQPIVCSGTKNVKMTVIQKSNRYEFSVTKNKGCAGDLRLTLIAESLNSKFKLYHISNTEDQHSILETRKKESATSYDLKESGSWSYAYFFKEALDLGGTETQKNFLISAPKFTVLQGTLTIKYQWVKHVLPKDAVVVSENGALFKTHVTGEYATQPLKYKPGHHLAIDSWLTVVEDSQFAQGHAKFNWAIIRSDGTKLSTTEFFTMNNQKYGVTPAIGRSQDLRFVKGFPAFILDKYCKTKECYITFSVTALQNFPYRNIAYRLRWVSKK